MVHRLAPWGDFMEYDIRLGRDVIGKAEVTRQGLYYLFSCRCKLESDTMYRVTVSCGGHHENLGVLVPMGTEFGLDTKGAHIVNGHVPVEQIHGESPVKCGGKLLIIDGGFSKAYQKKTGIAGYTLVANSHGMYLVAHEPFESKEAAIRNESDIFSDFINVEVVMKRLNVADTDQGVEIRESIRQLEDLLRAYEDGILVEKGV